MTDQERADQVASELALVPLILTMEEGESGGPCRYCRRMVNSGESYTVGADGFEDHAACQ